MSCIVYDNCYHNEREKWETYLIEFCAPTLAGIKCGSLFSIRYEDEKRFVRMAGELNVGSRHKGIAVRILHRDHNRALIYVYREKMLQKVLQDESVWQLLQGCGYTTKDTIRVLHTLAARVREQDGFPHEIGIFLGYPIGDVKGFIEHEGQNFLYCGLWKVYENEPAAKKLFQMYDSCKECYIQSYQQGMSIAQLMVAV